MADHWLKLLVCTLMLLTFKVNSQDINAKVNLKLIANVIQNGAGTTTIYLYIHLQKKLILIITLH